MDKSKFIEVCGIMVAAAVGYINIVVMLNPPKNQVSRHKNIAHLYFVFVSALPVAGALIDWRFETSGAALICMLISTALLSLTFLNNPAPPTRLDVFALVTSWSSSLFFAMTFYLGGIMRVISSLVIK